MLTFAPGEAAEVVSPTVPAPELRPYLSLRPRRRLNRGDAAVAAGLLLASLALYTATMTRGLSSVNADSNELVTKAALLEVAHQPGSPLYLWIGKLFTLLPVGQIATRVTWVSAVGAAVAVALTFLLLARFISGERLFAAGVAACFAVSLTFWSQAVIAELYALNLAFVVAAVWCLLEHAAARSLPASPETEGRARRWLLAGAGIYAASLGVHLSNTMFLPCFALLMLLGWPVRRGAKEPLWLAAGRGLRRLDWRAGAAALGVVTLGLLPFLWLALNVDAFPASEGKPVAAPGWPLFYEFTLNAFAGWRFAIPVASWPDQAVLVLHLLERNFGLLLLAFLLPGLPLLLTRQVRLFYLFLSMTLANFVFYATYRVPDTDVFLILGYWALLPPLLLGLLWAAAAGARLLRSLWLPRLAISAILLATVLLQFTANFPMNNRATDIAFKDFYGNALAGLPQGAWIFQRGAALGYDLLYQTRLYGVRPDLNLVVGPDPNVTQSPPWPNGPAYSMSLRRDVFLPAFISDSTGANNKWFSPALLGMFDWSTSVRRSWLTLYKLSPNDQPPTDWLLPPDAPEIGAARRLDVTMTDKLTLLAVALPATAVAGRPIHVVRYWQTTAATLPTIATVFGDHQAVEAHIPLLEQLTAYLAARDIAATDLPNYVVKDEYNLIIPSNAAPGYYAISTGTVSPRLGATILDPAPPNELVPREATVGYIQVVPGTPAPDPLKLTAPGPSEELP